MTPDELAAIEARTRSGRGVDLAKICHEDVPRLLAEVQFVHGQLVNQMRANIDLTGERNVACAERDQARAMLAQIGPRADQATAAIERVRGLHAEYRTYDDCGHLHNEGDPEVKAIVDDLGPVCEDGYVASICRACCAGSGEGQTEYCASDHDGLCWPCSTIKALDAVIPPPPGEQIPGQSGFVMGECGHRVAGSEWRAGFRNCERCPGNGGEPADVWFVPKVPYDPDAAVAPRLWPGGRITQAAWEGDPGDAEATAARLLAAANAARIAQDGGA